MAEAAAQFQKGLDQLALLPDTPERQQQELEFLSALGAVLQTVKGHAAPETGQAYTAHESCGSSWVLPLSSFRFLSGSLVYHVYRGEFDLAQRLDEDLLRLSRQRNDSAGLVLGHYSSGRNLMFAGRFASSRSHLEEVLVLYEPVSHQSLFHQAGFDPHVTSQAVFWDFPVLSRLSGPGLGTERRRHRRSWQMAQPAVFGLEPGAPRRAAFVRRRQRAPGRAGRPVDGGRRPSWASRSGVRWERSTVAGSRSKKAMWPKG